MDRSVYATFDGRSRTWSTPKAAEGACAAVAIGVDRALCTRTSIGEGASATLIDFQGSTGHLFPESALGAFVQPGTSADLVAGWMRPRDLFAVVSRKASYFKNDRARLAFLDPRSGRWSSVRIPAELEPNQPGAIWTVGDRLVFGAPWAVALDPATGCFSRIPPREADFGSFEPREEGFEYQISKDSVTIDGAAILEQ